MPAHPFSLKDGGLGAIELAARVSYIDLNSSYNPKVALASDPQAIDGGRQTGYTLGLNCYPNDLLRFMLDYNHLIFDKINGPAVYGRRARSSGRRPLRRPVAARPGRLLTWPTDQTQSFIGALP